MLQCFSLTIKQHQSVYQPQKPSAEHLKITLFPLHCYLIPFPFTLSLTEPNSSRVLLRYTTWYRSSHWYGRTAVRVWLLDRVLCCSISRTGVRDSIFFDSTSSKDASSTNFYRGPWCKRNNLHRASCREAVNSRVNGVPARLKPPFDFQDNRPIHLALFGL